jgi:hypothetical protein
MIFYSIDFDLDDDQVFHQYDIWMNFSCETEDIMISASEGGKTYGILYPKYDAQIIYGKSLVCESLLNGKIEFDIEDTFLFDFPYGPERNGFWRLLWDTPAGLKMFNMFIKKGEFFYDEDLVQGRVYGVDGSGHYELTTSYMDVDHGNGHARPLYFIGLDVKLP